MLWRRIAKEKRRAKFNCKVNGWRRDSPTCWQECGVAAGYLRVRRFNFHPAGGQADPALEASWCSGRDLNPQAFRHTPLKRTCLPFHHPSVEREEIFRRRQRLASVECVITPALTHAGN